MMGNISTTRSLALLGLLVTLSTAHAQQPGQAGTEVIEDAAGPDEMAPDGDSQLPGISISDQREAAHDQFLLLFEEKRYEEALPVAFNIVNLARQQYGDNDIRLVSALNNLATTQILTGDLAAAETNYKISIGLIEKNEGILSIRLINPLIGLGGTYNRLGNHEQSIQSFKRALHVNHVNDGFYNFEQFQIRDGLTESYVGLNEFEDANFQQQSQLEIYQRKLGMENPEIAPALYKLASWYERSGQAEIARLTYHNAFRLMRESYGKNSPKLIIPMVGIANTYARQGLMGESASYFKKALAIVDKQEPPDLLQRAELHIELGDLYTRYGKNKSASENYGRAWNDLSSDELFLDQRDAYFEQPFRIQGIPWTAIRFPAGTNRYDPDLSEFKDGFVLAKYSVDAQGQTHDVAIIESAPDDMMNTRVIAALEHSTYRPRYAEGVAVPADGLIYRHEFRYNPAAANNVAVEPDDAEDSDDPGALENPGGFDGSDDLDPLDFPDFDDDF
jgi:tetratricopeptide (TPR) repeat protein